MRDQNKNMFHHYRLSEEILEALELLGYHEPTSIQTEVIPVMLEGRHVVAKAPTGSGKTAAFAIPVCEAIEWEENAPQALILEPTRELAVQVRDEVFHIGRKKRLKVPAVFGGFPIDKQIQSLRQKSHVVVGTPGRIMDLVRRESLKLNRIKCLVIDEADLMLDMGFMDEVKEIMALMPEGCRFALFSATLKPDIQKLIEDNFQDAQNAGEKTETVTILLEENEEIKPDITQKLYETDHDRKYELMKQILIKENPESCIIFCGTREMVGVLFQKLRRNRIFCGMIHGELEQKERLRTIDAFGRGCFHYLIATDVAARGIDFDSITHVIQYDFPTGRETYVHRIGRTGRNGKSGTAVSLVCEDDRRMLGMIEAYTGWTLPLISAEQAEEEGLFHLSEASEKAFWSYQRQKPELRAGKGDALNKGITRLSIGGGRKSKIRAVDIVGTICSIEGLEAEDIGNIDIRESLCYVDIFNHKGQQVLDSLQEKPLKGKIRKVRVTRSGV